MNIKRKNNQMNMMLMLMIGLIMGTVILTVVFTFVSSAALNLQYKDGEQVVVVSQAGTLLETPVNRIDFIGNANFNYSSDSAAVNFTEEGALILNGSFTDATYTADYYWEPSGYNAGGTTKTILALITVMMAIVLVVFAIGPVISKN